MSLAALLLGAASAAQAQVVIGGQNRPRISVDLSVLDQLGPAPTLPQLFLSQFGAPARVATRETRTATVHQPTRVATRRPVLRNPNLSLASADLSDSNRRVALTKPGVIHLTPPTSRVAAATPAATPASVTQNPVSHDQVALTQPTRPSVAALTPPAAAPAAPAKAAATPPVPQDVPTPPALTQAPPHDAPPTAPVQPPVAAVPQSVVRQTPPAPTATSTPTAVTPPAAPTAAAAPPLQMASAGSAGIAPASVKFAAGATELPSSAQPILDGLVAKLVANDGLRIQLIAHASGTTDQAIEARRISLARAVAVRAYLIDKGIRSLRVDVRALGNRADDGVAGDQVDLVVVSQ